MGRVLPLQSEFRRMVRDVPRNRLPKGACWTLTNEIPDSMGAPTRIRGGWRYYSDNITSTVATSSKIIAGAYGDQMTTPKLVVVDEDGRVITVATNGTGDVTDIGAGVTTLQNPVQLGGKLIIPAGDGTTGPKKYDGTTLGNLGGTPPAGKYAAVWKALLLLGNVSAQPQRLYFSTTDYNPETWDTTNTYWDFSYPIKGIAPMRNAVLIFSDEYTSRLRGSTPPPGGDLIADDPVFNIGVADARSIATWNEQVVWASPNGIYITDGTVPNDLTLLCGMKTYWQRTVMANWDPSTQVLCGGIIQNYYIWTLVTASTGVVAYSGMIDLGRYQYIALSNMKARALWRTTSLGGTELLFAGHGAEAYVGELSTFFSTSSTYMDDGDGTPVLRSLETPYYEFSPGIDSIKNLYVTYDLTDPDTADNEDTVMTVSYITDPESTSYTTLGTLPATSARDRRRVAVNRSALGAAFKIEQTYSASRSTLWELAAEGHGKESSRQR